MNLHEYQAKGFFAEYGIKVPPGKVVRELDQLITIVDELEGDSWMVKAQVHAGGRGKAGGVKRATGMTELNSVVSEMLGSKLTTQQSIAGGLPITSVLVESLSEFNQELYLSAVVDRSQNRVVFIASPIGGMDIEEVAATQPGKIITVAIDPRAGVMPYQCRQLAFDMNLSPTLIADLTKTINGLYQLFIDKDLSLIEINPLVITTNNTLLALDGKINVDDNALYRQKAIAEMRDESQEDAREFAAQQMDLNYVSLDGNIGCMVNGAGLAMATMDLIKLHGGEPANFLDVGGGITVERVIEAFKLVISGANVKAILVNIFGGIVRCDLIADGIIQAMQQIEMKIPVVVRLEGTNVEQGRELLNRSGLSIITADGLADAAVSVIKSAKGGS